jgi:BioD-like phosphotransacetylase family protein
MAVPPHSILARRMRSSCSNRRELVRMASSSASASETTATRPSRPIYVAATRQHVGKTSVSSALVSGLQKRFDRVGFIKPVGQQSLTVMEDGRPILVDKDVVLVKEHFQLNHLKYKYMSPVLIPPGYTKDYLDGRISDDSQQELIQSAFVDIAAKSDVVLCEGTGHCAVGSIVNVNNAKVASWLGADMVLVANGGLGRAYDELELNRILCQYHGVNIAGVVINKVQHDKYDQTRHYLGKALEKLDIPLLGVIPDRPFLGCPAIADLEKLFRSSLLCGEGHRLRHYTVKDLNLVATSLSVFLENLRDKQSRTLYVCHSSRNDILLGFLGEALRRKQLGEPFEAALVVAEGSRLDPHVTDMMDLDGAPPILVVPCTTREAMEQIHSYTPKLNVDDSTRVDSTVQHYEPYIDFELLLQRTGNAGKMKQRTTL